MRSCIAWVLTEDIGLNWESDLREDIDMRLLVDMVEVWEARPEKMEAGDWERGVDNGELMEL
jgi:hypothetical protein